MIEKYEAVVINFKDKLDVRLKKEFGNESTSAKSLEVRSEKNDKGFIISIYGAGHLYYADQGRNPTGTNAPKGNPTVRESILQWMVRRNIQPKGKETKEQIAYAISRKIHKEGYRGKNILNPFFKANIKSLQTDMKKVLQELKTGIFLKK